MDILVSYSVGKEEEMSEAIINAFHAANINVFEKPTHLVGWINPDAFEALHWTSDRPLYLSARIWDQQVVLTAGTVRIYDSSNLIDGDSTIPNTERTVRTDCSWPDSPGTDEGY